MLHVRHWLPPAPPKAVLLLVHGVGEHSGRYHWLAERLTAQGVAVHGWDQRGHGLSAGRRGHVRSWSDYSADLQLCLEQGSRRPGDPAPLFLLGHSMGALVALHAVLHRSLPLAGLVISGVPLQPAGVAKSHLVMLAQVLARLWPTWPIRLPLTPDQLMSRAEGLAELAADPLMQGTVTARWGVEAIRALAEVRPMLPRLNTPLLVLHGGLDPVNLANGAHCLVEQAGSIDKTLCIYPRSRHEPHQDVEREALASDVAGWVLQRAGGACV